MTKEIKVIDYVMGTGKSTYLLKKLQKDSSILEYMSEHKDFACIMYKFVL